MTPTSLDLAVFADDVFTSTDLNRRAAEVLNSARTRPVTISRNNEQFALLRRDQAAALMQAARAIGITAGLLRDAGRLLAGEPVDSWLRGFGPEDLRTFSDELLAATSAVAAKLTSGERADWEDVLAIIHEWHESALVAQSGTLEASLNESSDEIPLADPRLQSETCPTESN